MDKQAYKHHCDAALERLADAARTKDEFAYLHAILGINGGAEDVGWQPSNESRTFVSELVSLINTPLYIHTKARLALVVYCHITEANFLYHDVFNLLLAADGQPVRMFNFTHKVQNGKPPSVNAKLADIKATADRMGHGAISVASPGARAQRDTTSPPLTSPSTSMDGHTALAHLIHYRSGERRRPSALAATFATSR